MNMQLPMLPRFVLPLCTLSLVFTSACVTPHKDDTASGTESESDSETSESETTGETTAGPTETTGDTEDLPEPVVEWPLLDCDPLVPSYCGFPFPSNVFTIDDASTPTGRRLMLGQQMMPVTNQGIATMPDVFSESDGFSAGAALMAHLPGATTTGLAHAKDIARSLESYSPTVLLNAETGELVPHFAELDMSTDRDDRRAFIIRPAVRLDDNTRYIVAIRNVVDNSGTPLPASSGFAALRDFTDHEDPSIDARRGLYEDIFQRLGAAGVERDDLQLAWDFSTASQENNTAWLLHMRDEALEMAGETGPSYEITSFSENWSEHILYHITGEMTVPLYLDDPGPGGIMQFGDDGMPEPVGTATYPFVMMVPYSVFEEGPAGLLQFGHGLFGSYEDVEDTAVQQVANDFNFIAFGFSWIGLSGEDIGTMAGVFAGGDISAFQTVPDRLQQGIINAHLGMRMMARGLYNDELLQVDGESVINPDEQAFFGASLGGILGSVYMATSVDVTRGGLGVPGQSFNLLLQRSELFDPFQLTLDQNYSDPIDTQLVLGLVQLLWDRAEPTGYTHHIIDNPLPGTPNHEVFVQAAIGDHLVSNYATHVMVRTLGIPNIGPLNQEIFGIEEAEQGYEGSAFVEYDFGLPPIPIENVPMTEGNDPHGDIWNYPTSRQALENFIRTGTVETFCDGTCDPD